MASEIKVDTIVNAGGDNDTGIDLSTNDQVKVKLAGTEVAKITTSEVSFNENSADTDFRVESNGQTDAIFVNAGDDITNFFATTTVNTAGDNTDDGVSIRSDGRTDISRASAQPLNLRRRTDDGVMIAFYKEASGSTTNVGQINSINSNLAIGTGDTGLRFISSSDQIIPVDVAGGSTRDASMDLGQGGTRMAQIFASVGSINTSDQNEKQNIETFTDAEMKVAKRISALFKKYKIKTAVTKKGDSARIHSGVIAQEVESAFKAESLDASKYSFWCSDTWWEVTEKYTDNDGVEKIRCNTYPTKEEAPSGAIERTRLGIRYEELLSFICAYNEQRFSSIEARLTALESK